MTAEDERDNTVLTVGQVCRSSPKNIAKVVVFYVFLVLCKECLIAMIFVNRATFMHFGFHCRAMELLHITEAVLSMKDVR